MEQHQAKAPVLNPTTVHPDQKIRNPKTCPIRHNASLARHGQCNCDKCKQIAERKRQLDLSVQIVKDVIYNRDRADEEEMGQIEDTQFGSVEGILTNANPFL